MYSDTKREIGILTIEYEELLQIHTEQAPPIYDYFSQMVETITNREEMTEESQSSENELLEFIKDVDFISITNNDGHEWIVVLVEINTLISCLYLICIFIKFFFL